VNAWINIHAFSIMRAFFFFVAKDMQENSFLQIAKLNHNFSVELLSMSAYHYGQCVRQSQQACTCDSEAVSVVKFTCPIMATEFSGSCMSRKRRQEEEPSHTVSEVASSSLSDVHGSVIIRKLPVYIFDILLV
jgi:hypothetical protein